MANLSNQASFRDVVEQEHLLLGKQDHLIGLAFSGGGIRSATFNLGILQSLASASLLNRFDYLSTVSGGGYIGSFLTSLLHRTDGNIAQIEHLLAAEKEAPQVGFLRRYSNYLTPKIGLSTDAMAAFAVWLTNTMLNQIILVSFIAALCAIGFALNSLLSGMQGFSSGLALLGFVLCLLAASLAVKESFFFTDAPDSATRPTRPSHWRLILILGLLGTLPIALWVTAQFHDTLIRFTLYPHPVVYLSPFWLVNPAIVGMISLSMIILIGLIGRGWYKKTYGTHFIVDSFMREWWARLGGVTLYLCGAWIVGFFLVIYLPLKLDSTLSQHPLKSLLSWGTLASISVFLGKSSSTSGLETRKLREKITIILPWLIIGSMVVLVSFGVFKLSTDTFLTAYPAVLGFSGIALACGLITILFAYRVDINVFSLHYFYRNRLTRAYLGATNPARNPSPFTGFDPSDDVYFSECRQRPLHIVNTALNLTNAKELAWQQRLAASFSFTPLYAGFELPNGTGAFRPTSEYNGYRGIRLGSIMAVSGAAASPNSGYHTSSAVAFLMTMFNARLGRWYGNPMQNRWQRPGPVFGFNCLVKELVAKTDSDSSYVYLSDGGHFENLGIYELVRRQCKLIIASDAGQDGDYVFEDLGNAIRKCQVDFGVGIQIEISDIQPTEPSADGHLNHAKKHFAIGDIIYDKNDPSSNGILLYIKNSLVGDEPAELINYKRQQPAFPHHSTVDQFFDESQFECYRHLGQHIANKVLENIAESDDMLSRKTTDLLGL